MHLDSALTMSKVVHFLFCDVVYVGKDGREVKISHMLICELPVLFVFIGIERFMAS